MTAPVMAVEAWSSNAALIADAARLGYLAADWLTLDPTYGRGTWWKEWRPDRLIASDLVPHPDAPDPVIPADFRALPWPDDTFDAVTFDPPYKLNGTPTADVDGRYGVHVVRSRDDRHRLMVEGLIECARVTNRFLLVKCQDQVEGGKVRWQTDLMSECARQLGLRKVDAFLLLRHRPQPPGRTQQHARRNYSTLLVFRKGSR